MSKARMRVVFAVFFILIMCVLARLFYIQVYDGKKLAKLASAQRTVNLQLDRPRNDIVDRSFIPFTNRDKKFSIILKPLLLRGKENDIKKVCELLGSDFVKIQDEINLKNEPILIETNEQTKNSIIALGMQGVSALNSLERYDNNTIARHVLGYLNKIDQNGEAGVEKYYENVLKLVDTNNITVITDARNNPLQGLGYRIIKPVSNNSRLNVKLTLDYHIQKIVEDVMKKNGITGAVVAEDVASGEIVAMASKPDFNQDEIDKFLNSPRNELFNRAVASYNLGSIFKIIDVAEAFEEGKILNERFFCSGSIKIGDKEFKCSSYETGGHGEVGLIEAFEQSCNPYFINLGIKIGSKNLLNMAKKFGIGSITGIREQGIDEAPGNLPPVEGNYTDGDIANISIGQGDIMATPLQTADIVATVANGGIKNSVNIVDSIVDIDGNKVKDINRREGTRIISKETADKIKFLMEKVTSEGTGVKAKLEEYGGSGGKTGSAETGQYINGNKVVQAWFAGYFPKNNPKYSICVFVEDGKYGGQAAAPIFAEIAAEIMKKGY